MWQRLESAERGTYSSRRRLACRREDALGGAHMEHGEERELRGSAECGSVWGARSADKRVIIGSGNYLPKTCILPPQACLQEGGCTWGAPTWSTERSESSAGVRNVAAFGERGARRRKQNV